MLFALSAASCVTTRARFDEGTREITARGENTDEVVYRVGPIPAEWRRLTLHEGADMAWEVPASGVVVHTTHACGRSMDSPLPSLVQQLLIGFTDREFVEEETLALDGREARHVLVRAKLDGRPIMLEIVVLKKDGCVFDLSASGEPERLPAVRAAFRALFEGLRVRSTPLARAAEGS